MYTVFAVIKGKQGGEETAVSTGFANRGEASRFAVGLAKTGKTIRVDIREDPDPTLLETLLTWRERIKRTDPALPEGVHFDVLFVQSLDLAIGFLEGNILSLLIAAYEKFHADLMETTLERAPRKYEILDQLASLITAFEELAKTERGGENAES